MSRQVHFVTHHVVSVLLVVVCCAGLQARAVQKRNMRRWPSLSEHEGQHHGGLLMELCRPYLKIGRSVGLKNHLANS